ncbi:glycosylation-dependent cell adhesion molecule 1-like [Perognathus longimembris pacificus]|uniref:glycosylation-dependent cell adhesion molecule 1-like n=1 Tax=Perognathus longimembris pacificus TaxID=214514 RepID=UPI00201A1E2D|nr:glycosylation-dependent cell adhesion molecule 1-like [Perognathus longimembris pacificus]
MKFFTVLLLASLATTSLAAPHATQITQTSHSKKDHISNEDHSKEPFIFREELISEETVVIQSTRPHSQKAQQQQEDKSQNAEHPSEKITEFISRPASSFHPKTSFTMS